MYKKAMSIARDFLDEDEEVGASSDIQSTGKIAF